MRFSPYSKQRNFSVLFTAKCVSLTFFFGTLILGGFYTGSFMISSVTSSLNTIHPTSIPGIKDQEKCENTGRVWRDNKCWDYQHNPAF
ncbi:hypothetical protein ACOWPH_17105 [Anabaena sp. PCC 7938]|uniref:Uncharacterized protein n=1 Tax=Anabaena cylindrica (strain ATCC 27899 / PCC 7122) TaxID=272123 RepID=K9ZN27_ANACC|nr:hypothetical protein [Anabaena sp. CCAP 1446/1C]AFZ59962.1 hypothetical protein Anacy_4611 [Anabaena cylindrica PCC 7122]MBY5282663.1 hypothetical protein [Anabaena sp. CCAP 1446/1C]MCM2404896.1 hypothetical protein [Anabaena sp. CCAP 1446/1C]BAY02979.1 hypothetical protein NIES19_22290 [Anabaena cylindrica PCC 7122]